MIGIATGMSHNPVCMVLCVDGSHQNETLYAGLVKLTWFVAYMKWLNFQLVAKLKLDRVYGGSSTSDGWGKALTMISYVWLGIYRCLQLIILFKLAQFALSFMKWLNFLLVTKLNCACGWLAHFSRWDKALMMIICMVGYLSVFKS